MINALIILASLLCFGLCSHALERERDTRAMVFLTLALGLFTILLTRTIPGGAP